MQPSIINAKSIKEARFRAVNLIMQKGKINKDQRGEQTKYIKNLIITIPAECCENSEDPLTARCDEAFATNLIDDETAIREGTIQPYTYGSEMRVDDALNKTIELLRDHPETRRAVIPLFKPWHVGKDEVPCMSTICFDVEDDALNLTIFARSNDDGIAMKSDLKGYAEFLKWVAWKLGSEAGIITLHAVNAHCRVGSDMDEIKKILKEGY